MLKLLLHFKTRIVKVLNVVSSDEPPRLPLCRQVRGQPAAFLRLRPMKFLPNNCVACTAPTQDADGTVHLTKMVFRNNHGKALDIIRFYSRPEASEARVECIWRLPEATSGREWARLFFNAQDGVIIDEPLWATGNNE